MSTALRPMEPTRPVRPTDPLKFYAAIAGHTPTIGPIPPAPRWSKRWLLEQWEAFGRYLNAKPSPPVVSRTGQVRQWLSAQLDQAWIAAARCVRTAAIRLMR